MKYLKRNVLLGAMATSLLLGHINLMAEPEAGQPQPNATKIEIKENEKIPVNRPKAPSRQHIECWYIDGEISLDFVISEGECALYLTDYSTGFSTQFTFDSADHADIPVGSLPAGGSIEIHTDSGNIYCGFLKFE